MTFHGPSCSCCQCRPTPDELPLARRSDRFDKRAGGAGRDNAPQIEKKALGPSSHLDSASSRSLPGDGHLGTGSDSPKVARKTISGSRGPRVDWGHLQRRR